MGVSDDLDVNKVGCGEYAPMGLEELTPRRSFRLMPRLASYKIGVTLGWVSDMNGRPAALNLI